MTDSVFTKTDILSSDKYMPLSTPSSYKNFSEHIKGQFAQDGGARRSRKKNP